MTTRTANVLKKSLYTWRTANRLAPASSVSTAEHSKTSLIVIMMQLMRGFENFFLGKIPLGCINALAGRKQHLEQCWPCCLVWGMSGRGCTAKKGYGMPSSGLHLILKKLQKGPNAKAIVKLQPPAPPPLRV